MGCRFYLPGNARWLSRPLARAPDHSAPGEPAAKEIRWAKHRKESFTICLAKKGREQSRCSAAPSVCSFPFDDFPVAIVHVIGQPETTLRECHRPFLTAVLVPEEAATHGARPSWRVELHVAVNDFSYD